MLFCGGLVFLSSIRPMGLWNLLSLYPAMVSVLLVVGSQWIAFANRFQFPHFPSFTYFALSSIYILGASVGIIVTRGFGTRRTSNPPAPRPAGGDHGPRTGSRSFVAEHPTLVDLERRYDELHRAYEDGEATGDQAFVRDVAAFSLRWRELVTEAGVWLLYAHLRTPDARSEELLDVLREQLGPHQRIRLLVSIGCIDEELGESLRLGIRFAPGIERGYLEVDTGVTRNVLAMAEDAYHGARKLGALHVDALL